MTCTGFVIDVLTNSVKEDSAKENVLNKIENKNIPVDIEMEGCYGEDPTRHVITKELVAHKSDVLKEVRAVSIEIERRHKYDVETDLIDGYIPLTVEECEDAFQDKNMSEEEKSKILEEASKAANAVKPVRITPASPQQVGMPIPVSASHKEFIAVEVDGRFYKARYDHQQHVYRVEPNRGDYTAKTINEICQRDNQLYQEALQAGNADGYISTDL